MLVSDDAQELLFQFGTKPWSQMDPGLTAPGAESVLHGITPLPFHGYLYKCFDKASGQSYMDPRLEAEIQ